MDPANESRRDADTIKSTESQRSLWSGWQKGVAVSCVCNIVVLILSLALLIWAGSKPLSPNGTYILWRGSYKSIKLSENFLHLGINIVSAIILAGSNYTLQVLVAPTRRDIDRAHCEKRYRLTCRVMQSLTYISCLDIGISSLHNWRYIPWRRKLLYIFLLVLTLPVHLL